MRFLSDRYLKDFLSQQEVKQEQHQLAKKHIPVMVRALLGVIIIIIPFDSVILSFFCSYPPLPIHLRPDAVEQRAAAGIGRSTPRRLWGIGLWSRSTTRASPSR
jgi:hypothetical protein